MIVSGRIAREGRPPEPGWLRILDGRIAAAGDGPPPAGEHHEPLGGVLVPGFVDLHVHGALGADFGSCTVQEARRIIRFHAGRGSTSLVATLASAPLPRLERQLALLAELVASGELAGLHLEGPFLAAERRGAHDPALLRAPACADVARLLAAGGAALTTVTLAPELPGALEAIRAFADAGVRVQLGHTACSAATARAALSAGAVGFTHLCNGMPPLEGRAAGPVGAALMDDAALLEVIGDGHHLSDDVVDLMRRVARERTALVSDAMSATGLGDGAYAIAGSPVVVVDGVARVPTGSLAGSTSPIVDAVLRLASRGAAATELVRLSSGTAARALGARHDLGPGAPADLVQLVDDGAGGLALGRVLRAGAAVAPA